MSKVLVDRDLLAQHVSEVDSWNESVQKIIGEQPGYRWASLEELRSALAQPAEAEGGIDLKPILEDVEREYEMGGLSDGLYADYASDVAKRYASASLSAVTAERDGEAESCEQWRNLALQFDRHRVSALAHLKMAVAGQDGAMDACRDFLAAPPVPGHAITEEIDQLRAEVEALRSDAERFRWLAHQGDACQWMNIIRVDPDDFESYAEAVDAAMAAKEA